MIYIEQRIKEYWRIYTFKVFDILTWDVLKILRKQNVSIVSKLTLNLKIISLFSSSFTKKILHFNSYYVIVQYNSPSLRKSIC